MYVHTYVCIYTCTHIYVYIYIYIYLYTSSLQGERLSSSKVAKNVAPFEFFKKWRVVLDKQRETSSARKACLACAMLC